MQWIWEESRGMNILSGWLLPVELQSRDAVHFKSKLKIPGQHAGCTLGMLWRGWAMAALPCPGAGRPPGGAAGRFPARVRLHGVLGLRAGNRARGAAASASRAGTARQGRLWGVLGCGCTGSSHLRISRDCCSSPVRAACCLPTPYPVPLLPASQAKGRISA